MRIRELALAILLETNRCTCLDPFRGVSLSEVVRLASTAVATAPTGKIAQHCLEFFKTFLPQMLALSDEGWVATVNAALVVYDPMGKKVCICVVRRSPGD